MIGSVAGQITAIAFLTVSIVALMAIIHYARHGWW